MRSFTMACLTILGYTALARADRMPDLTPLMRVAQSEVTVIGKVTSIETESVVATNYPAANVKTKYTIATVKIETNVRGAKGVTHIKVGFYPGSSGTGGSYKFPTLSDGQEVCVFLVKHHEANFYVFPSLAPPLVLSEANKEIIKRVKKTAAVFDDPSKALKAESADDRLTAACMLAMTYQASRRLPNTTEKVPLEESQTILKVFAEADWAKAEAELSVSQAFLGLGVTADPKFAKIQPKPGDDLKALWQAELKRWLPVDGKDFRIDKFVPKPK